MSPPSLRSATFLALPMLLAACAGTRTASRPAGEAVLWPVGTWEVAGRVTFPAEVPASASRVYRATLIVDAGNTIQLVHSDAGACGGGTRSREGVWTFRCGEVGFRLDSDGETIVGSLWATTTFFARTGERRCLQYRTDPDGRRECVRWDEPDERMRKAQGSGQLAVTRAG